MGDVIRNNVRACRTEAGWTQQQLAQIAGISRQALSAIESGKSVPSTDVGLRLARALGRRFEELFSLSTSSDESLVVHTAVPTRGRVAMGRVDDRWVAHPVDSDTPIAADGVANAAVTGTHVRPLRSASIIEQNVLVAGCAPALGMLGARLGERPGAGRLRWLPRPSLASLDLLREGLVHVAGLHLLDESSGEYNVPWIRDAFADRAVRVVTLARWQQGLAVARDNPRGVRRVIHLARPGVRVVRRPSGSGAQQLLERHLRGENLTLDNLNIVAQAPDHGSVARLISMGLADSGPCIESVAMEFELDFVPLAEERFDLVVPVDYDELPSVRTLLAELDTPAFRRELDACGGYQSAQTGHVVEVVQ